MASGSRRRGRIIIYVVLILILALVAVWAVIFGPKVLPQSVLGKPTATPAGAVETVSIVVAKQPVPEGTQLTNDLLMTIPYPKQNLQASFVTDVEKVIGKRAKSALVAQLPITMDNLVENSGGSPAAYQFPKGMVAVSIPISRLSDVSYGPQAGDHVNVIVTLLMADLDTNFQSALPNLTAGVITPGPEAVTSSGADPKSTSVSVVPVHQNLMAEVAAGGPGSALGRAEVDSALGQPIYVVPSEAQRPRMVSQSLLQDAIVLQVGTFPLKSAEAVAAQPTATPAPNPVGGNQQQQQAAPAAPVPPDIITLVVTPQDAVTLNFLIFNNAKLTLALRSAGDDERVKTDAVTLQYLMDTYSIPVPAKLPYGLEPRVNELQAPALANDTSTATPR